MSIIDAQQLAPHLARQARLTDAQARDAITAFGHVIVRQVQAGHAVAIEGFGIFDKGQRSDNTPALRFRQAKKVQEQLK
jgi:nucleoid DNA-binding protein